LSVGLCVCVCVGHGGHQQLHRVITLPANTHSSSSLSASSSVPDWVQRSVKFIPGPTDRKPAHSASRLSVTGMAGNDCGSSSSLCHVPLSPQSSDASSGSAGAADMDDTATYTAAGMQGTTRPATQHPQLASDVALSGISTYQHSYYTSSPDR